MTPQKPDTVENSDKVPQSDSRTGNEKPPAPAKVPEVGGPKGPEPTRYGDWEVNGRCSDF